MHLTLIRKRTTDDSILGELYSDPETRECYTLENKALAIPEGTYDITLFQSPRFKTLVPLLHNVPGHSFIEIHFGNTFKDTERNWFQEKSLPCVFITDMVKEVQMQNFFRRWKKVCM